MTDNLAIKAANISKKYCKSLKHTMMYGIGDIAKNAIGLSSNSSYLREGEFWALDDVSFEVNKGETIGIIGANGSGKSTLLKLLNGIFMPDKGRIEITGRVGALIEVGAGFHPMLTGRENIYVNGSILGMSKKEIDKKFDEIVDFAGISDFIDAPVKHYSSGMYVRLGFAVAVHCEPDILLVDEVLAVGDAKYQVKCFRKFEEFKKMNRTILFVTHSAEQIVRHCDRAILINDGAIISGGNPSDVSNRYMDLLFGKGTEGSISETCEHQVSVSNNLDIKDVLSEEIKRFIEEPCVGDKFSFRKSYSKTEYRWGNRYAEIVDYLVLSDKSADPVKCKTSEDFYLYLKVKYIKDVKRPIYGLFIKTVDGITISGNNSRDLDINRSFISQKTGDTIVVHFHFIPKFTSGEYMLSVGVAEDADGEIVPLDRRYDAIHLTFTNQGLSSGLVDIELKFEYMI